MLLDNYLSFQELDSQNMLAEIDALPEQLVAGFALGNQQPLPEIKSIKQILLAATGASAMAATLLATYVRSACSVPIHVVRGYTLPAFARGPETLVIAISHSGESEETLAALAEAHAAACTTLSLSSGGSLAKKSTLHWVYAYAGPANMALGYQFGALLALFERLNVIPPTAAAIQETVTKLKSVRAALRPEVDAVNNPAKRTAGQAAGRYLTIYGADYMAPVARRWAAQINLLAKSGATFAAIPEADHDILAGTENPAQVMLHTHHIFLRATCNHPRNKTRLELTRQAFMLEALSTDTADARGETPLTQMWTMLLFGDYVAYYLAMIYGANPSAVEALTTLQARLNERK